MYLMQILFSLSLYSFGCTLDTSPVFIINYSDIKSLNKMKANPLEFVNEETFSEIAEEVKEKSDLVILFVLDTFSTEDITRNPEIPFKNLKSYLTAGKLVYLPSVMQPYAVLSNIYDQNELFRVFTNLNYSINLANGQPHFHLFLEDNNQLNRTTNLRRHDEFINNVVVNMIQGNNLKVVAFLTGLYNPVKCDARACYVDDGKAIKTNRVKLWLNMYKSESPNDESEVKDQPIVSETITDNMLNIRLKYIFFKLDFVILLREDDWVLDRVSLIEDDHEVNKTNLNISEAWNRGYGAHKGFKPLVINNTRKGSAITIKKYQIQPYRIRRKAVVDETGVDRDLESYGDPSEDPDDYLNALGISLGSSYLGTNNNSNIDNGTVSNNTSEEGPYFTSGILTSLIILAFSIIIMSWGITMLFNCHSNDRYDDPTQKPLVIAAS